MNNNYKNSQKILSIAFFLEMITMFLNITALSVGLSMRDAQVLGLLITFSILIGSIILCSTASVILLIIGVKKMKKEAEIEKFIDFQMEEIK